MSQTQEHHHSKHKHTEETSKTEPVDQIVQEGKTKKRKRKHKTKESSEIPVIDITESTQSIVHVDSEQSKSGLISISQIPKTNTFFTQSEHSNIRTGVKEYLEKREKEFQANYTKPEQKQEIFDTNDQKTLQEKLSTIRESIQSNAESFDISQCNFNEVQISAPLYQPDLTGMENVFLNTADGLLMSLAGKTAEVTIDQMKSDLNASYLKIQETKSENTSAIDYCAEVSNLFEHSVQHVSFSDQIINLSQPEVAKMISLIAEFFAFGVSCSPKKMLDEIFIYMTNSKQTKLNTASLQSSINRSQMIERGGFPYFIDFVINLIQDSQCSAFLKYISRNPELKAKYYYADAPIQDGYLCKRFCDIIEKIDCVELNGILKYETLPMNLPPISSEKMAIRVAGNVNDYITQNRDNILQGFNVHEKNTIIVSKVLLLFADIILTNSNGSKSSTESMWTVYETVAKTPSAHPEYPKFVSIVKSSTVNQGFKDAVKAWKATIQMLNDGILPYFLLFCPGIKNIKSIPSPMYYQDSLACLRISHALLPLNNIKFNIDYETIHKQLKQ
ncbi:hypothetical protein GPJ56_004205 [Histomonas meleagridis]|uniref:uncharacterized protein n=1 Tax=Histomonas meleagridis TaxID=135588 RepID=UPI003559DB62|nr:hypothetical protein GPJ56_004205 [Histomonas meleagridis]KAH0802246.1 hypothetical protein GO595_004859 [Histomonas meleagridis]